MSVAISFSFVIRQLINGLPQNALEELAERVHGDMRMALNQLQYMSLSLSSIKYDDIKQRMLTSSKDEDISPFSAVDKYGFVSYICVIFERLNFTSCDFKR